MPRFSEWDQNEFKEVRTDDIRPKYAAVIQGLSRNNSLVGICFKKSTKLALLIRAVQNSGNAFCWLDPQADVQFIKSRCLRMRVQVILAGQQLEWPSAHWTFDAGSQTWICQLPYSDNLDAFGPRFSYSICTSGTTTGQPKVVLVPPEAIMPNVRDFCDRFNLDANSKLMWSTSLEFDPSLLELLMAFGADCSIFIVNEIDLKRIWLFASMISKVRPTLLQITPAVLSLFSDEFLRELFGPSSPVENLLIGGDTFPVSFIKRYSRRCSSKIYNVYGLTEVSCWASCTRFDPERDNFADASDPIFETRLFFGDNGVEICGRSCVVNGEKRKSVQTEDQFLRVEDDGRTKFVVVSREKINGAVVSREVEEFLFSTFDFVQSARLVTFREQLFVFIRRVASSNAEVRIPHKFAIRSVFYIDQFPITTNGKIDDSALRRRIHCETQLNTFTSTISEYLRSNPNLEDSTTISSLGFSSRDLFEFIFEVTQQKSLEKEEHEILRRRLFDDKTPASFLFELVNQVKSEKNEVHSGFVELKTVNGHFSLKPVEKIFMKGCVDFAPEYYDGMIFVGDMSGYFTIFDLGQRRKILEKQHESAVITKCLIHPGISVHCTVDGQVHWTNLRTMQVRSIKVGPSIRAEPLLSDGTRLFVATFSTYLTLLDLVTDECIDVCELYSGQIRNPPLIIEEEFVVVSAIDGTLSGFRIKELTKPRWRRELKKSLFASLFHLSDTDKFGALTLNGDLHIISANNGRMIQTFNFNALCSTEPTVCGEQRLIVIPCDKDLIRLVDYSRLNEGACEEGAYKLPGFCHQSRVAYSPRSRIPFIKGITPDNPSCKLLALDFKNLTVEVVLELDAPSFGDPLLVLVDNQEKMIVGTRDNSVYIYDLFETS